MHEGQKQAVLRRDFEALLEQRDRLPIFAEGVEALRETEE